MNNQLIPVFAGNINNQSVQLVDARLLHSFLEVARDFSTWIKDRIEEYGFIENIDFLLPKFGEQKGRGGYNKIDYHLTLDMAKELSMVERNDKGREARRYFIDCEQQLHAANPVEKPEALTLEAIERLIEQKLNANSTLPTPLQGHADKDRVGGIYYPPAAPGCVRVVSDIDIAELNRQLSRRGYRLVEGG